MARSGWTRLGRDQVGLDAQRIETVVGREAAGDVAVAGGRVMDHRQPLADQRRGDRIGMAVAQQRFPYRVQRRIEILHDEETMLRILADKPRHRFREDPPGDPEPRKFMMIAGDRRFPELRDLELRQRALQAQPAARKFDQPDLGRNAALERPAARAFVGADEAHARERGGDRRLVERLGLR